MLFWLRALLFFALEAATLSHEDEMSITIYHNPQCSKSRKTLELLQQAGITPRVIEYLDTPPSAKAILRHAKLIGIPVAGLLRRGEEQFRQAKDLPDLDDDAALAAWLESHPRVIERPIVIDAANNRAVIGRPPENVLELVGQ
jgi:arsenate reductase